jgi:DNA-binding MarR family transcriptional regulator
VKNLTDHSEIYLNFLRISGDLRKSPAYPQLDLPEERLLDLLAFFWNSGKKITVLKAMQMSSDASSTTVHRRLKTLRLKGMLELQMDEDDNRVKYINSTQLSRDYLSHLGKSVVAAATAKNPDRPQ